MMTDFDKPFAQIAQLMKSTRAELGLTQRDLAQKLGVHFTYISKIENQRLDLLPSQGLIKKLADLTGLQHSVALSLVGYIDCKALQKQANDFQYTAELLRYIASGQLSKVDIIFIVMNIRAEMKHE